MGEHRPLLGAPERDLLIADLKLDVSIELGPLGNIHLFDKDLLNTDDLIEAINGHADEVTEQERGEAAVVIAAAKQVAIDVGLEIGTKVYDLTGARATSNKVGLDIFWRNIRTHSLHDPVAHKRAEVGRYALLGEIPAPTWYT